MAARFTPTQLNAFKRTLLARLPACFFTAADVAQLQKETGVDGERIHQWATNFSKRVTTTDDRAKYLSTPSEDAKEVLHHIFAAACCGHHCGPNTTAANAF
jgi:hypothetical protein